MRALGRLLPVLALALTGCSAAASDADGEVFVAGPMAAPAPKHPDAVPVLVDTDLAPDDLAALALLARHPDVEVVAITVPLTGELGCVGRGLVADLFDGLGVPVPPLACGTTARGPGGVAFPQSWTLGSIERSGLPGDHDPTSLAPVASSAAALIARMAHEHDGLQVVALGPLTELAAVQRRHPEAYARLAGITTMAGAVGSPSHAEGIAEWNAGADPVPFAEVVAGAVPVTVVPDDPVPPGAPAGLAGPVVGGLGRAPGFETPAYWDLATAGVFVTPAAATTEAGLWSVDSTDDRGRLTRTGEGPVRVVTAIDAGALDEVYRDTFGGGS